MLDPIDFAFLVGQIAAFALLLAGIGLVVRAYRESETTNADIGLATQRALDRHNLA